MVTVSDTEFDTLVGSKLRNKSYDPFLAPPCANLDKIIVNLKKKFDTVPDEKLKPILNPITKDLMREAYTNGNRIYLLTWDEAERKAVLYRRGTC